MSKIFHQLMKDIQSIIPLGFSMAAPDFAVTIRGPQLAAELKNLSPDSPLYRS